MDITTNISEGIIHVSDKDIKNFSLLDLVELNELQTIQDAFAVANDVASIITDADGV